MKKRWLCCLLLLCLCIQSVAQAAIPYDGYVYDAWGNSVPAPVNYVPVRAVSGLELTGTALKNPADVFVSAEGLVYLSDRGNNRILILGSDLSLLTVMDTIILEDGTTEPLSGPAGLFVDENGQIYVCQPDEGRVALLDRDGRLIRSFTRPESNLMGDGIVYAPSSVLVNTLGTVFVLVDGLYLGAVLYDRDARFLGFYGANEVNVTGALLADRLWKSLLTQEQAQKMTRYVPVQFSGFDIDEDQFIYTCTNQTYSTYGEISKLNALGDDVLVPYTANLASSTGDYGDLERAMYMGQMIDTRFIDLCVTEDGLIFALDRSQCRIFEYDREGRLLGIFGAQGSQLGAFKSVQAIDTLGSQVLVLDPTAGLLTAFEPSEYGALMEQAVSLYNDGLYAQARLVWEEVLARNVNCELAWVAIGKALYEEEDYAQAMVCFERGYDRVNYSRAFKEYRMQTARVYLPYGLTALAVGIVVLNLWRKWRKRRRLS